MDYLNDKKNANKVILKGRELNEYDLECPKCGAQMKIRHGRFGLFYGCENYFFNCCSGKVGAKNDGTPVKIPDSIKLKNARKLAQEEFELLWKECFMSKKDAFSWAAEVLGVPRSECYIPKFTINQCFDLIKNVRSIRNSYDKKNKKSYGANKEIQKGRGRKEDKQKEDKQKEDKQKAAGQKNLCCYCFR